MKIDMGCIFLALIAMPTAVMADSANSPVERVVKLIEQLKADLEKDEKVEAQIHDKFACWCKKATGHKAANIHINHMKIDERTNEVLDLKSEIAVLAAEIAERHEFIATLEDDMKKATNIRSKENAAYMKETGELMQAISATERAITVLSGAGTKTGLLQSTSSEALSSSERAHAANLIKVAVNSIPVDGYKALTPKKVSVLSRFTEVLSEDRESFQDALRHSAAQEPLEIPEGVTAADGSSSYAPQSATVQGILKDMYDSFSEDLESQTESESKANRQFEDLIAEKTEQVNHKNEEIMKREETKAEVEAELADKVKALDDLIKTYEADKKFFDETEAMCRAKHEEWVTRSEQRMEELEGIKEALKILTSDEARALFGKAIKPGKETSFLQLDSFNDESAPASKAWQVLKDQATKTHSIRLAALAARVRTTGVGHFDLVITEIDKVIETLKEEEKEDIKQRDFCKEEYHKNDEEQADLTWKIKVNEEMIAKLEEKIAKLDEQITATAQEIKDTKTQIKEMEDERISEHEAFQEAKADDEAASELLGQAIEAMSKFYKKEGVDMGPIQGSMKLLQKEPEFEVSQWQAPDMKLSDKGKRKNQSKGIISILTMLKEDLEDEIKNGIKDEVAAQTEFEAQVATAKALIKDLTEKKIDLENTKAETDEQREMEHTTMKENKGSLTDKQDYRESITEGCDWLLKAFDERVQKRKAEMEGLVKAKEYLAGAAPPAMLETSKTFDDNKLSDISFHGISFLQRQ